MPNEWTDLVGVVRAVSGEFKGLNKALTAARSQAGIWGYVAETFAGPFGQAFTAISGGMAQYSEQTMMTTLSDQVRLGGSFGANWQANSMRALRDMPIVGGMFQREVDPHNRATQRLMGFYGDMARFGTRFTDDQMRHDYAVLLESERGVTDTERQVDRIRIELMTKRYQGWLRSQGPAIERARGMLPHPLPTDIGQAVFERIVGRHMTRPRQRMNLGR